MTQLVILDMGPLIAKISPLTAVSRSIARIEIKGEE